MKKSLVALAALAAVGIASAQSTATISGQFRIGFKTDANGLNTVTPDQTSGNVMNFNIAEDLGGGLSAIAATQLRFDASNGGFVSNANGATASAAGFWLAHVGLRSTKLGTFQMGRIGFDTLHGYNPFGTTGASLTTGTAAGATENGQFRYTSPSFMGLNVVLGGSMKGNNTATTTNSGGKHFLVNYANGPFAASYVQEVTAASTHAQGIGASYDLKVAKVFATKYSDESAAGKKTIDRVTLSASAPVGPFVVKAGLLQDKIAPAAGAVAKDKTSLAVDYALSKRTTIEAQTYKTDGERKRSMFLGVKHTY